MLDEERKEVAKREFLKKFYEEKYGIVDEGDIVSSEDLISEDESEG